VAREAEAPHVTRRATARLLLALAAAVALAASGPRPALADGVPAWERELRREQEEQTAAIEQAQRTKSMAALVQRYASRASRDGSATSRFLYGRALYHADDAAGARAQMTAALEIDPRFWPAHVKLAHLAAIAKDWPAAESHLSSAFAARPDDVEALQVAVLAADARGDMAGVARYLERLVDASPADLEARRQLVRVRLHAKEWDASRAALAPLLARDPRSVEDRLLLSACLAGQGKTAERVALLEEVAKDAPEDVRALAALEDAYEDQGDRVKAAAVLEKLLPLVPPERRKAGIARLQALRAPPSEASPREVTIEDVVAAAKSPDVERRREALRAFYEACRAGKVREVPKDLDLRPLASAEPDLECRAWIVKILAMIPTQLRLLARAVYDESAEVRSLAFEALGSSGSPAAVAYLAPFLGASTSTLDEFNVVRAAFSRASGVADLPSGTERVSTEAEADANREFWRRWRLSDASTERKLEAVRGLVAVREWTPEWYLVEFVEDPTFSVMREAYVALRAAVTREPATDIERKMLPRFPRVDDAELTRAGMRALQDRVATWWDEYRAERAAARRATGK
jgi:tetratricopeptide (TPR) repeat protein